MYKYLLILALMPLLGHADFRDRFWPSDKQRQTRERMCRLPRLSTLDDSLHQYNTLKIWSSLEYDIAERNISGWAKLRLVADEIPLSVVDLRLVESLAIDSAVSSTHTVDSAARAGNDSLQVYLTPSLLIGDTAEFTIYYHGTPSSIDGWGGMSFGQVDGWRPQICYTMGDGLALEPPPANYAWLPSFADPNDKVTWECWLRVPNELVGVSSGARLASIDNGDGTTTWHYRLDQQVSTYLLFVSVSDYEIMTQRESGPVIENFVYPSRWDQAQIHFEPVPECLDSFAANFGPYVFDRFGYNMTRNGDMEHATCVSHLDITVVSNRSEDWLLFHELSHQWWGNWVTVADWRDLWLNEGFASYCEALGMEWVRGEIDFRNYVRNNLQVTAREAGTESTIYDPDFYWSNTVYEKGACVMHMLRWVMGDSLFFSALRDYGQQFAFGNATTVDFQTVCETHYDSTLQWFFDEWVFEGVGYPRYSVVYSTSDVPRLRISQTQSHGYFTMPIEIAAYVNDAIIMDTIWVVPDANGEWFTNEIELFDSVKIDPTGWILKTATHQNLTTARESQNLPQDFTVVSAYPNPFNPMLSIIFNSPAAQQITLRAFNIQGQLVHEQAVFASPGSNCITWQADQQSSGIYWIKLSAQTQSRTIKAVLIK